MAPKTEESHRSSKKCVPKNGPSPDHIAEQRRLRKNELSRNFYARKKEARLAAAKATLMVPVITGQTQEILTPKDYGNDKSSTQLSSSKGKKVRKSTSRENGPSPDHIAEQRRLRKNELSRNFYARKKEGRLAAAKATLMVSVITGQTQETLTPKDYGNDKSSTQLSSSRRKKVRKLTSPAKSKTEKQLKNQTTPKVTKTWEKYIDKWQKEPKVPETIYVSKYHEILKVPGKRKRSLKANVTVPISITGQTQLTKDCSSTSKDNENDQSSAQLPFSNRKSPTLKKRLTLDEAVKIWQTHKDEPQSGMEMPEAEHGASSKRKKVKKPASPERRTSPKVTKMWVSYKDKQKNKMEVPEMPEVDLRSIHVLKSHETINILDKQMASNSMKKQNKSKVTEMACPNDHQLRLAMEEVLREINPSLVVTEDD